MENNKCIINKELQFSLEAADHFFYQVEIGEMGGGVGKDTTPIMSSLALLHGKIDLDHSRKFNISISTF